jgi:uncharacterized glyoxalase superfamily protein PhnB
MTTEPTHDQMRTEPAPFLGRSLSLSLTVKDLQESLVWYHEVIGFSIDQRYERDGKLAGVSLNAGSVRILINQDDGARGWDRTKGEGFSYYISTDQNIDDLARGIRARGGRLDSDPADMPWGVRAFRLSDPDGYRFTISS